MERAGSQQGRESIRRWDDKKNVTDQEREVVIEMMTRAMQKLGHDKVEIVRK